MAFLDCNGVTTLVKKLKTKFQETLVSGTNIKTVNGSSILGSGNLVVSGSDKITGVEDAAQGEIVLFGADGYTSMNSGWSLGEYGVADPSSILGLIAMTDSKIKKNIWYGTCPTGATAQTKVVTTSSGDFSLATGSMVRVKFTNAQTYNGGIKLNVDGTGAHNVMRQGTTATVRYFFLAGEVVDFVYDGTNYIAVNEGIATTTYYGVTKLSSATNSTSTTMAATPNAVKAAYDHADSKQDALVSGTNIKTINGESILGSGDITVGGGGGSSGLALNVIKEQGEGTITYRLDKTVSEIVEALNSGISPVIISTTGTYNNYFSLKSVSLKLSSWEIQITDTSSSVFKAIGANAYPSYTRGGGGDN